MSERVPADLEFEITNQFGRRVAKENKVGELIEAAGRYIIAEKFTISSSNNSSGTYSFTKKLPDNAIVQKAWYDVITTFAGDGDDSSTIALSTGEGAGDLVAAVAISDGGNPWDAGIHDCIPSDYDDTTKYIKMTAENTPTVTIAVNATDTEISAGEMVVFIEYVVSA